MQELFGRLGVLLALRLGVFGEGFQAIVSGINPGWNVGRGVIHSGTAPPMAAHSLVDRMA